MTRETIKKVLTTLGLLIQILAEFVQGVKKDFKKSTSQSLFPNTYFNMFFDIFQVLGLRHFI